MKKPVRRLPIRRRRPATPRWSTGRRLTAYGKQAVSVLVLMGTLFLREQQVAVPVAKRDEEAPPDVWAVDLRGPEAWWGISGPSRKVPAGPFPGQKTPPCSERLEEAISGGCWLALEAKTPCPHTTFEHAGRCFYPVRRAERLPTSVQP